MAQKLWAHHPNGVVREIISLDEGLVPGKDIFHPDIASDMSQCGPGVDVGYRFVDGAFVDPAMAPVSVESLRAHAHARQADIMASGMTVNVGSVSEPLNVFVSTDAASLSLLTGLMVLQTPNAVWVSKAGSVTLSMDQISMIAKAAHAYVQATFAALAKVLARIDDGSITTIDQIDTANWTAT